MILSGLVLPGGIGPTDPSIFRKHCHQPGYSGREPGDSFTFMFYNTENLFDAVDDPLTDDQEFLPEGERGWNYNKYYRKLHSVAKVILSAGTLSPPAIIGLCETENSGVAEALVNLTPLSSYDYEVVYLESSDSRGIDVCLLYDRSQFRKITSFFISPNETDGVPFRGRPVLYAKLETRKGDLHVMINHWPSRRGGVLTGQPVRIALAERIVTVTDSLRDSDGEDAAIIVAGDFNCSPLDREMAILGSTGLVNLSLLSGETGSGTYRYRGTWQHFDQVIVSESMINGRSGFRVLKFEIHQPAFLFTDDPVYPGRKPLPTYDGFRYAGGYSDHLPVLLQVGY